MTRQVDSRWLVVYSVRSLLRLVAGMTALALSQISMNSGYCMAALVMR